MKKRTLLTVSAVFSFLLLFALAVFAGAEETTLSGTCGETATWRFEEETGTLYIEGSGAMTDYSEDAPAPWCEFKESIAHIVFSDDITAVGAYSFIDCTAVEELSLPDNVSIGNYAFSRCGLTFLELPDIGSLGWHAFSGCENLNKLILHDIGKVGSASFADCTGLSEIVIDGSVADVANNVLRRPTSAVFYNCPSIASVRITGRSLRAPANLFYRVKSMKRAVIEEGVTSIGDWAFCGCNSLIDLSLPQSLKTIDDAAFCCCPLQDVTIPEQVELIDHSAFYYSYFLVRVTIKNPECTINTKAFDLTHVTLYGYEGSTAEAFAEEYGFAFRTIDHKNENAPVYGKTEPCAGYVRERMLNKERDTDFLLERELQNAIRSNKACGFFNEVFAHDVCAPSAGDYLRWSIPALLIDWDGNVYYDILSLYYTTAEQEAELDAEIGELLPAIITDGMTDYEKTKAIFDHLRSVEYYSPGEDSLTDDPFAENDFRTAYSALVNGKANCQGFAQAFYRLALEAGVNARIVVNNAIDHAWNVVELNGEWYHLDASLAAYNKEDEEDSYFLKSALKIDGISVHPGYSAWETPLEVAFYHFAQNDYCAHDFVLSDDVPSTCTELGYGIYTCTGCGDSVKRAYTVYGACIDQNADTVCDVCGEAICEHIPVLPDIKEATCTSAGFSGETVCGICGRTLVAGKRIPKLPHTDKNSDGICDTCDQPLVDVCDHENVELIEHIVPSTCIETGYKYYTCSFCGKTVFDGVDIPLADHVDEDGDTLCDVCGGDVNQMISVFFRFRIALKTITNLLKKLIQLLTSL